MQQFWSPLFTFEHWFFWLEMFFVAGIPNDSLSSLSKLSRRLAEDKLLTIWFEICYTL